MWEGVGYVRVCACACPFVCGYVSECVFMFLCAHAIPPWFSRTLFGMDSHCMAPSLVRRMYCVGVGMGACGRSIKVRERTLFEYVHVRCMHTGVHAYVHMGADLIFYHFFLFWQVDCAAPIRETSRICPQTHALVDRPVYGRNQ